MSHYLDVPQKKAKEVQPGIWVQAFWQARLMASFVELKPNVTMVPHRHAEEQFGYVISGDMRFVLGGEARVIGTGDSYLIPSDVEHGVTAGPKGARIVDVFSPPRKPLMD